MRILIDANGGDKAPNAQIDASVKAVEELGVDIILVGKKDTIKNRLSELSYIGNKIEIVDAPDTIENTESPVDAVKKKENSSIVVASRMLKEGRADALITSGSTGAMLVCGLLIIGRIKGIKRPALATLLPTKNGPKLLIDSGANTNCSNINLLQFAQMGSIYMKLYARDENPSVGLISNGEEDEKGNSFVKGVNRDLKIADINFIGNIEGRDVMEGKADVTVCDGFIGNIILKTIEGTASVLTKEMKIMFTKSIVTKISAIFVNKGLKQFKKKYDYREYGGAPLLGVNSLMIKAHGSSDEKAFLNAIKQAINAYECDLINKIRSSIITK